MAYTDALKKTVGNLLENPKLDELLTYLSQTQNYSVTYGVYSITHHDIYNILEEILQTLKRIQDNNEYAFFSWTSISSFNSLLTNFNKHTNNFNIQQVNLTNIVQTCDAIKQQLITQGLYQPLFDGSQRRTEEIISENIQLKKDLVSSMEAINTSKEEIYKLEIALKDKIKEIEKNSNTELNRISEVFAELLKKVTIGELSDRFANRCSKLKKNRTAYLWVMGALVVLIAGFAYWFHFNINLTDEKNITANIIGKISILTPAFIILYFLLRNYNRLDSLVREYEAKQDITDTVKLFEEIIEKKIKDKTPEQIKNDEALKFLTASLTKVYDLKKEEKESADDDKLKELLENYLKKTK